MSLGASLQWMLQSLFGLAQVVFFDEFKKDHRVDLSVAFPVVFSLAALFVRVYAAWKRIDCLFGSLKISHKKWHTTVFNFWCFPELCGPADSLLTKVLNNAVFERNVADAWASFVAVGLTGLIVVISTQLPTNAWSSGYTLM
jgi:hypothetical protein